MDAAVATSIALAVTFPQAGNLGGGGFLLYAPKGGEPAFLDYRETAPRKALPELFLSQGRRDEKRAINGGLPVGTPGTVAGLAEALAKYGTWSWKDVVSPSIELARKGVWLTTRQSRYFELYTEQFRQFAPTAEIFLPQGQSLQPGECFAQPVLAHTLERLATQGPRSFYEGEIARQIATTIAEFGGVLDEVDLAGYQPVWRRPHERRVLGRRVITPSLPSSGGIVLSACLGLFEAEGLGEIAPNSIERYIAYARVMQTAFRLRGALLGDPARISTAARDAAIEVAERPFRRGDLAQLQKKLERDLPVRLGNEQNTTHLCVIDKVGNAVSNTYSLNTIFGAKLVVRGGGFFLNNTIDDFSLAEGAPNWYELSDGKQNLLEPGKRPVSSMTPTIILSGTTSDVDMVLGGSGGPRIPTMLFQIAQGTLGDHIPVDEAVRQPRVHHQHMPDEIAVEHAMSRKVRDVLADYCEPGESLVETPILGIAAAIHVDDQPECSSNRHPLDATTQPADGAKLSAVLDSRFALV